MRSVLSQGACYRARPTSEVYGMLTTTKSRCIDDEIQYFFSVQLSTVGKAGRLSSKLTDNRAIMRCFDGARHEVGSKCSGHE